MLVAGSYGVVGAEINFTANADAVTFTTVTGQQYLASSLGAALTFSAGDNAEIVRLSPSSLIEETVSGVAATCW